MITLINPYPYYAEGINDTTTQQPLSILYPATLLKSKGFEVKIIDSKALRLDNQQTLEEIKKYNPKIVGISVNAITQRSAFELSSLIKKYNPDIKVIFGGPQPTSLPKKTLSNSSADAVIVGESELTLLEIMQNLKEKDLFKNVEGIIYKKNNKIISNKPRKRLLNLDSLPFPDYNLLPNPKYYFRRTKKHPAFPLLTSRGCPYQCIYCSRDVFQKKVTFRSPENIVDEIAFIIKNFKAKQIDIIDDHLLLDKERAKKIFNLILEKKYKIAINVQSGVRVESIDEEILRLMKQAGVYRIAFGVESGDERVLNIIKKGIKLEDVEKAIELTKKAGIRADCFFMIGLPGDTPESMQRTIDFAKKLKVNTPNFCMTVPFPGTELYNMVKKEGNFIIDPAEGLETGYNNATPLYELGDLKKEAVQEYYKKAYNEFYIRPTQIFKLISEAKSISELKWLIKTGMSVFKTILFKK